ncbi:MAG: helix-hairpin-helix domain-containing protein [Bacteroidota bacterium]
MKAFLQDYFTYTRSEQRGSLVLILICLIILLIPALLPILFPKKASDFSAFEKEIAQFEAQQQEQDDPLKANLFAFDPNTIDQAGLLQLGLSEKVARTFINYREKFGGFKQKEDLKKVYGLTAARFQMLEPYIQLEAVAATDNKAKYPTTKPNALRPFPFDPNTASQAELMRLGLSKKVANNIISYRTKVKPFRQKEDLQKVYTLTDAQYQQLEAYVEIEFSEETTTTTAIAENKATENTEAPTGNTDFSPTAYDEPSRPKVIIDINQASAEEWQQLKGIGPTYARRITKFRDALGGFVAPQQVAETYGLPDSTFQNILFSLRPSPIFRKLKINTIDAKTLKSHPYIKDWKTANIIVNYREQHGTFGSIEDLKEIRILTEELIEQLRPYLEF